MSGTGTGVQTLYSDGTGTSTVGATAVLAGSGGLNVAGGSVVLSGTDTFTGSTTVSSGTVTLGNNAAIENSALNTNGTGLVAVTVATPTFGGLIGGTNLASVIASGYGSVTSLTLNPGSGVTDSYSGAIADGHAPMSLVKTGSGTQILNATNTYTGGTTIGAGILDIATTAALPGWNLSGSYSVAAGATLAIGDGVPDSPVASILGTTNFAARRRWASIRRPATGPMRAPWRIRPTARWGSPNSGPTP